ncbi:MAG: hypothetical protein ACR2PW_02705 [Gammaproteobacteria bacterium]
MSKTKREDNKSADNPPAENPLTRRRIEHRGKNLRVSRTQGAAIRTEHKVAGANVSLSSSEGLRLSTRVSKGARIALQNGRAQLIGRWNAGPVAFNLSKTGASASLKNQVGTYNFLKPSYSSFKLGGIQVRGKKASQLQLAYIVIVGLALLTLLSIRIAWWLLWVLLLPVVFIKDVLTSFNQQLKQPTK